MTTPDHRYMADVRAEALRAALATFEGTTPAEVIAAAETYESYLLGREVVGPDSATAAELVTVLQDIDRHARENHPIPLMRIARGLEIATKIMEDAEATE